MQLKKILLTLITCVLLSNFQSAVASNYSFDKSDIFDISFDKENSEKETCDLEDSKFLNLESSKLSLLKIALLPKNQESTNLSENLSKILTSPPNA